MYWPDTGTGVDTEPARKPVASAVRKYFTEGGAGVPPTVPGGDWFNAITNEVLNVLDAAGIDPSKTDDDQLLQAIQWHASEAESSLRQELAGIGGASLIGISADRTQADKNAEWISITDAPYSVKFDNVTDNTAALNAAFQSGKKICIPDPGEGNFAMATGTVYYDSRTTIMGPGKYRPVIKASASMPGELDLIAPVNETYSTFSYLRSCLMFDLCVDANGFNRAKTPGYVGEWGRAIRIGAIYDSMFVRVNAIGGPQHGIDVACWKDNLVGIGHAGVPVGRPFNVVLSDCDTTDWVYDDGLTTHGCYNVLIEGHTSRITDAAKAARTYTNTQKAIEIDDGSHGVVLNAPRAYGNGTKIMAFSVATHGNAPAAYDVTWNDPWAHGCMTGIGGWADPVTDATYDTPNWRARKIEVNNFVFIKPTLDDGSTIFPSRFVDFQNFMDCKVNGVSVYIADDDGSYSAPASMVNIGPAANIDINDVNIYRVPAIPSGTYIFNRDIGWLRTAPGSRDIRVNGFSVDNVGYMNRIIGDSGGNALTVCKRINCDAIPSDGQTKTAIFSSAQAEFSDVTVPVGMVPYRIGRGFTAYPGGNYALNQTLPDSVTIGGYKIFSETLADGTQAKPGILFDNQFYSGTFNVGKGSVAFRTSAAKEAGFSVCAYHDDTNQYVPIVSVWDRAAIRSFEPGVDNTTANGRNTARWATGYFATNIIVTSDSREKTPPSNIDDALLDIADEISINVWKWLESITKKGDKSARWHFGPIAQQVRDAFEKHGLDGCDYGLLCYDKWDDAFIDIMETVTHEDGEVVERPTGGKIQVQWAGDRWGIRPDQCLWLIASAARRRADRADRQIALIEERLNSAGL
ncbi:tail fiber domain-containing protein [Aeromonas sp. QDB03]|uniref:tail fiber domain-containing protein n=1 Tax=Aeromonas sp. QDB03 TaxID=2989839 RepID=UPI0022E82BFA|nr:tail fiber domain-containing protein [Aeromonas sp. QDB03]